MYPLLTQTSPRRLQQPHLQQVAQQLLTQQSASTHRSTQP